MIGILLCIAGPYETYLKYIDGLPINPAPEAFGLHENADIAKDQNDTALMFSSLLSVSGSSGGKGGGASELHIAGGRHPTLLPSVKRGGCHLGTRVPHCAGRILDRPVHMLPGARCCWLLQDCQARSVHRLLQNLPSLHLTLLGWSKAWGVLCRHCGAVPGQAAAQL